MAAQKAVREELKEGIVEEAEEAAVSEEESRVKVMATAAITAAAVTSAEAEAPREAMIEDTRDTHRVVRQMAAREAGLRTCVIFAVKQDTTKIDARRGKTIENNLRPLSNSFVIC